MVTVLRFIGMAYNMTPLYTETKKIIIAMGNGVTKMVLFDLFSYVYPQMGKLTFITSLLGQIEIQHVLFQSYT